MRLIGTVLYMGSAHAVYTGQADFTPDDLGHACEALAEGGAVVFDDRFRLMLVTDEQPAPAELEVFEE
jgi:hypothetical protein